MSRIYNTSGGYRKLHSFNFATIIHLGNISFCKRYSWPSRAANGHSRERSVGSWHRPIGSQTRTSGP